MRQLNRLIDQWFPRVCCGCGDFTSDGRRMCDWCTKRLTPMSGPCCPVCASPKVSEQAIDAVCSECLSRPRWVDRTEAAFEYDGPVADALVRAKWSNNFCDWSSLGEVAKAEIDPQRYAGFAVLPVPMHPKRLRKRGFSTASIWARVLFPNSKLENLVRKVVDHDQRAKTRDDRERQAKQMYELIRTEVPNEIVIVDDVMTTGATVRSVARLLKKSGAKRVEVCVLARDV